MRYRYAPIKKRLLALIIDYVVISTCSAFVLAPIAGFSELFSEYLAMALVFVVIALIMFYVPLCETFFQGQTVGKKLLGLRTVRTDGSPASGVHCLQRYLMLIFDGALTLGLGGVLSTMITRRRQRLGDLLADTMVVSNFTNYNDAFDLTPEQWYGLTAQEYEIYLRNQPQTMHTLGAERLAWARAYRSVQCDLARLRTHRRDSALIGYLERVLGNLHLQMFRQKIYTWTDMALFTLRSIPRAVYESRYYVLASLVIVAVAAAIGWCSQYSDPEFFEKVFGPGYANMTIENIKSGNPMGVYGQTSEADMFIEIFFNNLKVTLMIYATGVLTFIGPLFMLLNNFVRFAAFDAFFAQHSLLVDALVSPSEHGTLELTSIIMAGGASIRLGTGWLFPGRLTRMRAWARAARQSLLIVISTIPMLLVAAFIESFITRHTEWPMAVKLAIIILSAIIILGYYVMLPLRARRQ